MAVGAVRLLTIKLNKMTELQRQFMEETGVSFDGIPINGVHLEYITWLEAQIQALRQPPVSGRSEQLACIHNLERLRLIGSNITCLDCQSTWVRQANCH